MVIAFCVLTACSGKKQSGDDSQASAKANSADAGDVQTESGWPENEWTAQVPKPQLFVKHTEAMSGMFIVGFSSMTYDAAKAYAGQLEEAGFARVTDSAMNKDTPRNYEFFGKNAEGYTAHVSSLGKTLTISKE